jgi:hypothetical protein
VEVKRLPAFSCCIEMAGDIATAKMIINKKFYTTGACVTVEPLTFIYTGGTEEGMRIKLINYPRFPVTDKAIQAVAIALVKLLMRELNQKTAVVLTTTENIWLHAKPPGASI